MSDTINLNGLDKAEVLAALYNGSRAQGMGFLQYNGEPMQAEEARELLERNTYFDYLKGRVMKIDLAGDTLDPWLYDRDNGHGAAERIINALRVTGDTNPEEAELSHKEGTRNAAIVMKEHLYDESYVADDDKQGGMPTFYLGVGDLADELGPKLDEVLGDDDPEESNE